MKVIGAGFGRTGTLSIKAALEELGFGPCYHQFELGKNPEHRKVWAAVAQGEPVDWEELFEDYQATVDWPGCTYYKELMKAFPDAKVLLSVRDPDRWYESTFTSIYSLVKALRDTNEAASAPLTTSLVQPLHPAAEHPVPVRRSPIWDGTFSGRFEDRQHAIEVFNRHNEEVKRCVPSERLLVYEVKDGWEPLCKFLEVEVPKGKPFPRLNDANALLSLPYAQQVRERLEELQESYIGEKDRQVLASIRVALIPQDLSSKLRDVASLLKRVERRRLIGQFTKARSHLKRVRSMAKRVVDTQFALKAAATTADFKKGGKAKV